jgi:hypothetical protein
MVKTTAEKQVFDLQFTLASNNSEPMFAVKSCSNFEKCKFEAKFDKNAEKFGTKEFFRVNDAHEQHKQISLTFTCDLGSSAVEQITDANETEKVCIIAVGVYGNLAKNTQYHLSFSEQNTAVLLPAKHQTAIRLVEGAYKLIQFNFKPDREANYGWIDFSADINYGAASIKVSKGKQNLCTDEKLTPDVKINVDHSLSNMFGQKQHLEFSPSSAYDKK